MKKYFSIAVLCALAVLGLGSCAKDVEEEIVTEQTGVRTVTFSASLADQTKTGLSMKFVPNWINTSLENVHLFETSGSTILEGVDVEMRVPEDRNNEVAYFKADFAEEISIIVNPPSPTGVKTRAADEYTYTGIVAQKVDGKFTIPATQYPDAVSLIDPNADFLIGDTKTSFSESMALKEMDIYFVRPVSVSRLAIMNIEGQKVKTVKITSTDKLTASAAYSDVNFSASTVAWDNSGSNVITISYGEAGKDIPAEATFYAYFISLPGNKNITSVEVTTDQYVYTKSYASGKTLKFDTVEFRNIAVDMSKVDPTPVGPATPVYQDIYFFKNNGHVSEDSYDLYPGTTAYVTPELRGAATGATVTYSIACTPAGAATITPAGVVTPVAVGSAVITATASAVTGYKETEISYTLTITDSTPDAVDQELSFVKGGETVETDSFDLYPAGGTYTAPTLTGAVEGATVTYAIECTPEGVATIDASTGAVTPVAVGTAVITATASAVAPLYKQTSKSYTLTVTDSTPAPVEETTYEYTENLTPGTYVMVGSETSGSNTGLFVCLFPNAPTKSWTDSQGRNFTGQVLNQVKLDGVSTTADSFTTTEAAIIASEVELVQSNSNWLVKVKANNQYLKAPTGDYVITYAAAEADAAAFAAGTVSQGKRNFTTRVGNSTYYFYHSGSAQGFSIRTTSTQNMRFYKKAKKTQTLAFAGMSAEYDLKDGGSWTISVPELDASGAETTISYASSKTTVAEVDPTTGAITIPSTAKKGDSADITATAEETDEYEKATATYTISIVDSTPGVTVTYTKVTSNSGIVADKQYLVVYENGASSKVFKPIVSGNTYTASAANAIDAVVSNNTIESDELDDCLVTLEASGSNFFMKAADSYLYPSQSNLGAETSPTSSRALSITISGTGNNVTIKRSEYTHYLGFETYFRRTGSASSNMALYTVSDGTTPEPPVVVEQTLTFNPTSVSGKVGETVTKPTLTGAMTTVSYSSSNTAVVEVNSDGDLTLKAVGEAIITATAAAETVGGVSYAESTATYTVNVSPADPTPTGKTYTRISGAAELVTGTYIIVEKTDKYVYNASGTNHGGYGTIGTTEGISKTGTTITLSDEIASSYEFTFTRTGDNLTIQPVAGDFAGKYMYATNSVSNTYIGFQTDVNNFTINAQAGDYVYFRTTKGTSNNEYLYKKSSDSFFKLGGSGSPTAQDPKDAGIYLYKLNDGGTTPDDPEPPTPSTQYYTKINSRDDLPGTSQTSATGDYLFVYENGTKAYVFKAICDGTPTGAGDQSNGHVELTKTGSAIEVDLTENGIAATDAVKACKIQLAHHATATRNDWTIKPASLGTYWVRINNDRTNGVRILAMTSAGYSSTFTFEGSGNNAEIKRTDSSRNAYWTYNATDNCFEATATASKISVYKLSE